MNVVVPKSRRLKTIAAWINANLPELRAVIEAGYCNTDRKLAGTRFIHKGKGRTGTRLKVFRKDGVSVGFDMRGKPLAPGVHPILDHNAAETYRTNDDVERWLHNYRFCCKAGRHHTMFGGSGPCDTCGLDFKKKGKRK